MFYATLKHRVRFNLYKSDGLQHKETVERPELGPMSYTKL